MSERIECDLCPRQPNKTHCGCRRWRCWAVFPYRLALALSLCSFDTEKLSCCETYSITQWLASGGRGIEIVALVSAYCPKSWWCWPYLLFVFVCTLHFVCIHNVSSGQLSQWLNFITGISFHFFSVSRPTKNFSVCFRSIRVYLDLLCDSTWFIHTCSCVCVLR